MRPAESPLSDGPQLFNAAQWRRVPGSIHASRRAVPQGPGGRPQRPCHCSLDVDALVEPHVARDGRRMPVPLPLPNCAVHELLSTLPVQMQDVRWRLVFSSDHDGFSLPHLYRAFDEVTGPTLVLLVVGDRAHREWHTVPGAVAPPTSVIGAYCSDAPTTQHGPHRFFGSKETFVFSFDGATPASRHCGLQAHHWADGNNDEFMLCHGNYLGIGGGEDGAAIFLNADLQFGTTSVQCDTFACPELARLPRHGLRHCEFATYRLLWFSLQGTPYAHLSAIPPAMLLPRDGAAPRPPPPPGTAPPDPLQHTTFDTTPYANAECGPVSEGHHRCPYVLDACHRHPAPAPTDS